MYKNPLKHLFLGFPAPVDLLYQKAVANLKDKIHLFSNGAPETLVESIIS
jgi:hypothetical protein